ncbi:MAG TPA: TetR family transcriptional regulator [Candidatus Acidoferrum sp.]|nr:TetR family transcriptional regulator [Candidatus Acidoferrum sp.]
MAKTAETDPRTRILDAAEDAMGELGFTGTSLRHIAQEARVNLATVYYYFGSKRGLMEAVLKRRFGPLREEHLALLRRHEAAAKGRPLSVEKVLEAMLLPPLRLAGEGPAKRQAVTRLLGRIVTEPHAATQAALRGQRAEVWTAFERAWQRSLPKAPLAELLWRMEFVWGALAFILCNPGKIQLETHGACNPENTDELLAGMIEFFSPGFQALARGRR